MDRYRRTAFIMIGATGIPLNYMLVLQYFPFFFFFFFKGSGPPQDLPSSPTRRSSDLSAEDVSNGEDMGPFVAAILLSQGQGQPPNVPVAPGDTGAANSPEFLAKRSAANNKLDRKSTRLNSSHLVISYAVFCLKKKKK